MVNPGMQRINCQYNSQRPQQVAFACPSTCGDGTQSNTRSIIQQSKIVDNTLKYLQLQQPLLSMQVTRQPRIVSSTTCDMNMVDSGMQKINCQYNSQSHNSLASHVTTHVHIVLSTIQCKLYINQCMSTIGIDIYNWNNLFLPWK